MKKASIALLAAFLLLPPALGMTEATGSWSQINQSIEATMDWKSFVEESSFALGEVTIIETLPDGTEISEIGFGQYPRLDGSTVAVPMGMEIARQHLKLPEDDLRGFVAFTTTHSAYENLIAQRPGATMTIYSQNAVMEEAHPVDLILATPPSVEEMAMAKEAGVTLVQTPVCYDAFVFITHAENPIDGLTLDEIRNIYAGRIENWQEVGGPDERIRAYQREPNSGSQTAMEQLVMHGEEMYDSGMYAGAYTSENMSELVKWVGDYENGPSSIGYTYQYYLDTLYQNENVKVLAIDGVLPTPETQRDGSYPLTTSYYAVYRAGDEDAPAAQMTLWLTSEAGQRAIAQAGYIPVEDVK